MAAEEKKIRYDRETEIAYSMLVYIVYPPLISICWHDE